MMMMKYTPSHIIRFFEENLKYLVSSHHRENTFVTENEFFSLSQQYHDDTIDHEEYGQVIASYEDVDWSDSENECEVQERLETVWGYVEDTEREAEENVKNIHSEMKDLFGPSFLDLEENLKKLMDETEREMEK